MNLQENIRRIIRESNTEKIIRVIDNYIKENYPKFNEKDAKYEDYESSDGYLIITYHNPDGGQFFAIYRDKRNELELNRDIYNDLYMTFGHNVEYVIDWFNFEFGENAKYLVKPDKYEDDEDDDYFNYLMNQNLQESIKRVLREELNQKREGLLNLIRETGLYEFLQSTGLNYMDIGELPRDIKIQYLNDVVSDLEQLPYEFDLTSTIGPIPLFIDEDDNTVYVESIYNRNNKLKLYTYITTEDGYDEYNVIYEDDLDYETLDTLIIELSYKLQHDRN